MKVSLVTGHLGFVGQHLCKALLARGEDYTGLDLKEGNDICTAHLSNMEVSRVYHLAAQTDAQSIDVAEDARVNITGTLRILQKWGDKVVFASSSMVNYPVSPYAISKQAGEAYARYFGAAVVRFPNLYGDGGHSVIDKFRVSERLTIYGSGEQLRTYSHVDYAVAALLRAEPGGHETLYGFTATVNEIAREYLDKPWDHLPARPLDLVNATQL